MATQSKFGLFVVLAGLVLILAPAVRPTQSSEEEFRFDAAKLKAFSRKDLVTGLLYRSPA